MPPLSDRVALVTGSNRGLGHGIARRLAEAGADVIVTGRDSASVRSAARAISDVATGAKVQAIAADLSEPGEAHRLGRDALDRFGRLDILVNNAGMSIRGDSWTVSDEDWDYQMSVNLRSPFILGQYAIRDMIRRGQGGRIVNISSIGAQKSHRDAAVYDAAKGGLEALTRQLAIEVATYGITVNAVAPGSIVERPGVQDRAALRLLVEPNIPVGRAGRADDIAAAVLFFCQADSGFVTGQVLTVDGGQGVYLPTGATFPSRS